MSVEITRRLLTTIVRLAAADGGSPPPVATEDGVEFGEAIDWHRRRDTFLTKDEFRRLDTASAQRAFTVANVAQLDLVVDVHKAIDAAVAKGTTLADFKKEIGPRLAAEWQGTVKNPGARLETIFRTNVQIAYGAGRYQQAAQVADRRPYWRFDGLKDSRQSKICRPLSGVIRRWDDPWWKSRIPPLHFQCRSSFTTLTESQARRLGITTDEKLPRDPDGSLIGAQEGFGAAPETPEALETEGRKIGQTKVSEAQQTDPKTAEVTERKLANPPPVEPKPAVRVPQGTPVSAALDVPKKGYARAAADDVLEAIDATHGDGVLPKIPLTVSSTTKREAAYTYNPLSGKPTKIDLSRGGRHPRLSLTHELGHVIDHQAVDVQGQFASVASPKLDAWRTAVRASAAYQRLLELRAVPVVEVTTDAGAKVAVRIPRKHIEYLLDLRELWARSYAQYVAIRGGNAALLNELVGIRSGNGMAYPHQWSDVDFEPIAKAMDEAFEALGWVRET